MSGNLRPGRSGLAEKVRQNHDDGAVREDAKHVFQSGVQVRAAPVRFIKKNFADHTQDVLAAFARRDKFFHAFAEQDEAHLVIVADGGEGEHGGDFGGQLAFGLRDRTEQSRAAQVHQEHHGQLAFLDEFFDERMVHARGDVPIDGAHVVARLIFAHLVEIHSLPLED